MQHWLHLVQNEESQVSPKITDSDAAFKQDLQVMYMVINVWDVLAQTIFITDYNFKTKYKQLYNITLQ